MPKTQPVSSFLTGSHLQSLLERTQYLQSLTRKLREQIDPLLSDHISVINVRNDSAIIAADSPAWLSKIRYLAPVILQILQEQPGLITLNNVQFKVQPSGPTEAQKLVQRRINLSTSSAQALECAASGSNHPDLADTLRRISQKGKN